MPREGTKLDVGDLTRLYEEGLSIERIAERLGSSRKVVTRNLRELGLRTDRRRLPLDDEEIVRLYESGMTKHDIAVRMGTWDMVISRRLSENGHPTESRSDAMRTRLSRMTPDERSALAVAAHDAVRGMKRTDADLCKRAISREAAARPGSTMERVLGDMLASKGLGVVHQKAVGKYNVDLAVEGSVAVEVSGRPKKGVNLSRIPKRVKYLCDAGWSLVVVWSNTHWNPVTEDCAEYVVSFLDELRRNPSMVGEYRVIRGGGEFVAKGRMDDDEIPFVLSPKGSYSAGA